MKLFNSSFKLKLLPQENIYEKLGLLTFMSLTCTIENSLLNQRNAQMLSTTYPNFNVF